jgi:Na+-transporting methylmalonyl-CoA/oxaloacetate decarboxylase gamma subunit
LDAAINIFINGITGVFLGMAVLYLTMKIIALVAVRRSESEDKG